MTFSELKNHPSVGKVTVGYCIERGPGSRFRAKAHTHDNGDICFLSAKWLWCSDMLIHELAHAITGQGHNDKWRAMITKLGGTFKAIEGILRSYEKRKHKWKI